jgi:hypothetical protein
MDDKFVIIGRANQGKRSEVKGTVDGPAEARSRVRARRQAVDATNEVVTTGRRKRTRKV